MKTTLIMYGFPNGERAPVGFAFTLGNSSYGEPVVVTKIYVIDEYRGKGHGRAIMRMLTQQADREFKDLLVKLEPDEGMDIDRLIGLGCEFGFRLSADGTTMYRKTKGAPPNDLARAVRRAIADE